MPHPEREHELQIALATALRERDEARHGLDEWCKAAMRERARATAAESALAAARRECERLRKALDVAAENLCLDGPEHDAIGSPPCGDPICAGCVARAALASPAAGRDPAIEDADAAWRDGEAHGRDK